MSEITNTIQRLQSIVAGAKRELKFLEISGRNSISLIRSNLDLLNLDEGEDLTNLDLDSVEVEFRELKERVEKMIALNEKVRIAEKEIKNIKKQLE